MTEVVHVVPLDTPGGAHDARSAYVEYYWLPVLGPSATWLLRRVAGCLDDHPGGFDLDLAETAAALGISTASRTTVRRALDRLVDFGMAERVGERTLAVRRLVPPLPPQRVRRLPERLARELLAEGGSH